MNQFKVQKKRWTEKENDQHNSKCPTWNSNTKQWTIPKYIYMKMIFKYDNKHNHVRSFIKTTDTSWACQYGH